MTLFTIRSLCLSLVAISLAPLAAQETRNFAANRTSSYGIPFWAGGTTAVRGTATVTTPALLVQETNLRATISNTASVYLFGISAEGAAMISDYRISHRFVGFSPTGGALFQNTSTGSFVVRLAGNTVVSSTSTSQNLSGNLTANVFNGDGVVYDLSLLGLGIRVRGNILSRAAYNLTPTLSFAGGLSVNLAGPLRSSAVGSAGASVSLFGASAGTSGILTYADTIGTAALHVTPANATGTINYTVQPIQLALSVFATLSLPFLPTASASQTLFSYAAAAQAGTLNLVEN